MMLWLAWIAACIPRLEDPDQLRYYGDTHCTHPLCAPNKRCIGHRKNARPAWDRDEDPHAVPWPEGQ